MKSAIFFLFFIFQIVQWTSANFECGAPSWTYTENLMEITPDMYPDLTAPRNAKKSTGSAGSFSLVLNFLPTISQPANAALRTQFQRAADVWQELLRDSTLPNGDPLVITCDADVQALNPGVLGSTSSQVGFTSSAAGFDQTVQALAAVNGNTYPTFAQFSATLDPDDAILTGTRGSRAVFRSLGFSVPVGDGSISFSTQFTFDSDLSNGLSGGTDFLAVAVHELGHLLGFTSTVDFYSGASNMVRMGVLDLHRFTSATPNFVTSPRHMAPSTAPHRYYRGNRGGATPLFVGELSRGRGPTDGDGQQASHWRDDAQIGDINFIGMMDPTLASNELQALTPNDDEAFRGLGYEVNPAPCPIIYGVFSAPHPSTATLSSANQGNTVTITGHLFRAGARCRFGSQVVTATILTPNYAQVQCVVGSAGADAVEVSNDGVRYSNPIPIVINGGAPAPAVCGNGVIETGEQCDDSDATSGDGCSSTCQRENGFTCSGTPSICVPIVPPAVCGNNAVESGEQCDDGNLMFGDGCSSSCLIESGFSCTGSPSVCTPTCGNNVLDASEQCDDGDLTAGDGCDGSCLVESGFSCTGSPSVCTLTCGDGALDAGEQCDDGNLVLGDGCSSSCFVESGFACTGEPSVCTATCGDGILDSGEECDDGNLAPADGCSGSCFIEGGFSCGGEPSVCTPGCGNSASDGSEQCDDGNLVDGDGCSGSCTVEGGFSCPLVGACSENSSSGDNLGLIVGIVIAVVCGLCLILAIVGAIGFFVYKKRQEDDVFVSSNPLYGENDFSLAPKQNASSLDTAQPKTSALPLRTMDDIHSSMSAPQARPAPPPVTANPKPAPPPVTANPKPAPPPVNANPKPAPPPVNANPKPRPLPPNNNNNNNNNALPPRPQPKPTTNNPRPQPKPTANNPRPQPKPTANNPRPQPKPTNFKVGSTVSAQYSGDKKWYPAKILAFDANSNRYHVNYVDFGNDSEWVLATCVKPQ